jgi:tRNA dimethylallyltransferase
LKILSIIGPTAVGKTSFTLELVAEILKNKDYAGVDLISADSRQVYQGLEIISGADIPSGFKKNKNQAFTYSFLTKDKVNLHGVSIVSPDSEWSVAHFQDLAWEVIDLAKQENRLVIIIGGTGLYHDQLLNLDTTLRVKPNNEVRQKAETMKLQELQAWAQEINPARFKQLNNSDLNNPRRLIRLIEIGLAATSPSQKPSSLDLEQIYIGLNQDLAKIEQKIKQRVQERFSGDAIGEVKKLQQKYDNWSLPALSALGVSEISQYLNKFFSKEECLSQWTLHELQYARRQLTWWKNRDVAWFKIDESEWKQQAFTYILNLC